MSAMGPTEPMRVWVRGRAALLGLLTTLAWSFGPEVVRGQEMPVPIEVQAALFSRIVQFDRTFEARSQDGLVVGVLFQEDSPASVGAKEGFSQALVSGGFVDAQGRPPQIVELRLGEDLGSSLEAAAVDLLYVAPLRGVDLSSVSTESRRLGILTCSGVPEFAREGLAVGLDLQEGRPRILINLAGAAAEATDFRSALLKMAQIVGEDPRP